MTEWNIINNELINTETSSTLYSKGGLQDVSLGINGGLENVPAPETSCNQNAQNEVSGSTLKSDDILKPPDQANFEANQLSESFGQTSNLDFMQSASWAPPPRAFRIAVIQVTSLILFTQRKVLSVTGSREQCEKLYKRVLIHNLLLGWFGFPFGVVWTSMALIKNQNALKKIRWLDASGNVIPQWYRDPSGRYAFRYWNGQMWTDQVSSVQSDPLRP